MFLYINKIMAVQGKKEDKVDWTGKLEEHNFQNYD